jgi:hypothetical protein
VFYSLTAMSDRALAYSGDPLRHLHLVIDEAAGMASDLATCDEQRFRPPPSEGNRPCRKCLAM